jgi:predicted ATP-binding protein involved in virulence
MNLKKTLKPIKKKLLYKNNIFKTIKHVYPHLSDLTHKEILDYYQLESAQLLERHVEKIKEIFINNKQDYKENIEELDACFCTDREDDFKDLYHTQREANRRINIFYKEQRVKLKLYPCPYNCGWHLTKV